MTNLYPFTRISLELSFSELFFSDALFWNQNKFIAAFNIFWCRILIISCKILVITVISDEKPNELTIYFYVQYFTDDN